MFDETRPVMTPEERRLSKRYDIHLGVGVSLRSKENNVSGLGKTVNISSSGVLFDCDSLPAAPGEYIELTIDWPVVSAVGEKMCLAMSGYIVRVKSSTLAVSVCRYDLLPVQHCAPAAPRRANDSIPSPRRKRHSGKFQSDFAGDPGIIVIEDQETAPRLAAILVRFGHPIIQPDANATHRRPILRMVLRRACLVITNDLSPLVGEQLDAPVIYTGGSLPPGLPAELAAAVTCIQKPITYRSLIDTVEMLLAPRESQAGYKKNGV